MITPDHPHWIVGVNFGLTPYRYTVHHSEEEAGKAFTQAVNDIEREHGVHLKIKDGFATDEDDWEVRVL